MATYDYLKDKSLRDSLKTVRKKRPESNSLSKKATENKLSSSQSKSNPSPLNKTPASQEKLRRVKSTTTPSRKRYPKPSTKDLAISTKQLASMIRTGLPLLEALNISLAVPRTIPKSIYKEISIGISKGSTPR